LGEVAWGKNSILEPAVVIDSQGPINGINEINQMNQTNQIAQINQTDQIPAAHLMTL
jgi:hypothetical protein